MELTELPKNVVVLALSFILSNTFWSPVFEILFGENIPISYKLLIYTVLNAIATSAAFTGIIKFLDR